MVNCANEVSRTVKGITVNQLANQFQSAAQSHFSGRLDFLTANERRWSLYFRLGRLIWTAGGEHRFRRWHRLVKQFCPTIQPNTIQPKTQDLPFYWEYLVLSVLLKRQHVRRAPIISLIQAAAFEVLFDLLYASEQITQIRYAPDKQEQLGDPLAPLSAEQVLEQARQAWNAWNSAGLVHYSPNAVPVIKRPTELKQAVTAKTYQTLEALMSPNSTLRDLARATGQELLTLTRVLVPYIQRDLIELCQMPDLSLPCTSTGKKTEDKKPEGKLAKAPVPTAPVKAAPTANTPLVVCIDDSPSVCQWMEQIITAAGYRYVSVQDSVHALPLLLEKKPGLIFLDLVMPIASGYEICSQIRRMSAFKNTPVVILTGNDGIVDRVRARVVGASDFLSKSVNAEKVMAIVHQYLPQPAAVPGANTSSRQAAVEPLAFLGNPYEMGETTALLLQKSINETSALQ
ncbi:MAG TPA: response regulator [Coleofasciculaceae cyanobacterium]